MRISNLFYKSGLTGQLLAVVAFPLQATYAEDRKDVPAGEWTSQTERWVEGCEASGGTATVYELGGEQVVYCTGGLFPDYICNEDVVDGPECWDVHTRLPESNFGTDGLLPDEFYEEYSIPRVGEIDGVLGVSGDITPFQIPPSSLEAGAFESDSEIFAFTEKRSVTLVHSLDLIQFEDTLEFSGKQIPAHSNLAAGSVVNSYILHADRTETGPGVLVSGEITFATAVQGVIVDDSGFQASDSIFAIDGITYPSAGSGRGIENSNDIIRVSEDRKTLYVQLFHGTAIDQIRVLTESTLPKVGEITGVLRVNGNITPLQMPPSSLEAGAFESDSEIFAFTEKRSVTLVHSLDLIQFEDTLEFSGKQIPAHSNLAAGSVVNSYILHADRTETGPGVLVSGEITFATAVQGVIVDDSGFQASDSIFAIDGITYPSASSGRGIENSIDIIRVSEDRKTLYVQLFHGTAIDQIRVLTAPNPKSTLDAKLINEGGLPFVLLTARYYDETGFTHRLEESNDLSKWEAVPQSEVMVVADPTKDAGTGMTTIVYRHRPNAAAQYYRLR